MTNRVPSVQYITMADLESSLERIFSKQTEIIINHVDKAIDELVAMCAREFRKIDEGFDRLETRMDKLEVTVIRLDVRVGSLEESSEIVKIIVTETSHDLKTLNQDHSKRIRSPEYKTA